MSFWTSIGDTFGSAWNTVQEGAQQWVENEVGDWVSEQQGRPETVNQESSPPPYAGDAAVAQQQASAQGIAMNPMLLLLGAAAVYLIVSRA